MHEIVRSWDLERVVGQLFVVSVGHHVDGAYGFSDTTDAVGQMIADKHIGGICYFPVGDDGSRPEVISDVIETLRGYADFPLLATIDQEGGLVARMRDGAARFPSAMGQQASGMVTACATASGHELAGVGIDQTFAPNADINVEPANPVIGIRSASSDPDEVTRFVLDSKAGFDEAGIASCVKHFPGHGNTAVDSHFGLPVLDTSRADWDRLEALPFKAAIDAGIDSVMIGHLSAPSLDPSGTPATFSRPIVTDLLRHELGFTGVIVTDALDMGGATGSAPSPTEICINALAAGIDQLLMPRDPAACVDGVIEAVRTGRLNEEALRESASRIVALKEKLSLLRGKPAPGAFPDHQRLASRVLTRTVAWAEPNRTFILDHSAVDIIADPMPPSIGRGVEDVPCVLADLLSEHGFDVEVHELGSRRTSSQTILVTRDAWRCDDIAQKVRDERVDCHIAVRSPYDTALVDAGATLLGYSDIPGLSRALANTLISGIALGGLPIDLPAPGGSIIASHLGPTPLIRPYRDSDRSDIGRICIRTGASGQDATGHYRDDEILPYIYAYPYLDFAPELAHVVEVDGRVGGYILGVDSVADFISWWRTNWAGVIAERFGGIDLPDQDQKLVDKGLNPDSMMAPWRSDYPAEFHIDMMPALHGTGLGTALVDEFTSRLSAPALAIGVGGANTGALAFYSALGMDEIETWRGDDGVVSGYILGMRLP